MLMLMIVRSFIIDTPHTNKNIIIKNNAGPQMYVIYIYSYKIQYSLLNCCVEFAWKKSESCEAIMKVLVEYFA